MKLCECGCGQTAPIAKMTSRKHGAIKGQPRRFVNHHNRRGAKQPESAVEALRKRMTGEANPSKRPSVREKISASKTGVEVLALQGANHPAWIGDEVGYHALHLWVSYRKTKTGECVHCKQAAKRTEWANVSKEYKRDLDDFIELCVRCHRAFDRETE